MLEHTGANAECIYINANSGARKTRSFHKRATKTGSKGENSAVFGNSRTLFVQAFLTNEKKKKNKSGNVKSEHSKSLRSDARVSRQPLSEDLQVQTVQAGRCTGYFIFPISAKRV